MTLRISFFVIVFVRKPYLFLVLVIPKCSLGVNTLCVGWFCSRCGNFEAVYIPSGSRLPVNEKCVRVWLEKERDIAEENSIDIDFGRPLITHLRLNRYDLDEEDIENLLDLRVSEIVDSFQGCEKPVIIYSIVKD